MATDTRSLYTVEPSYDLTDIYHGDNPFEGAIVEPGDPDYDPAQNIPWSADDTDDVDDGDRAALLTALFKRDATSGASQAHDPHTGEFGSGGGDGASSGPSLPGIGNVKDYLAAHPREPGEEVFVYQARIVSALDPQTRHEMLFQVREKYPPVDYIQKGAQQWRSAHGLPEPTTDPLTVEAPLAPADEIAHLFEDTPDESASPEVQAAYADFNRQNVEMYDYMTKPVAEGGMAIKVDYSPYAAGDPYPSAEAQADDLRDNHHITTQSGLGGEHDASMSTEQYDNFRAVHDVFGHAGVGGGFDRHGEYEAWLEHMTMYTGGGARAMSSEYHGVNTALWAGAPGSPGTGKTILLPESDTLPWDAKGNLVRSAANPIVAMRQLANTLHLSPTFAADYDRLPWHYEPPNGPPAAAKRSMTVYFGAARDATSGATQAHGEHGHFGSGGGDGKALVEKPGESVSTTFVSRVGEHESGGPDPSLTKDALFVAKGYDPVHPYPSYVDFKDYAGLDTDFPPDKWQPGSVEALSQAATDWQMSFQQSAEMQRAADSLLGYGGYEGDSLDPAGAADAREMLTAMAGLGPEGASTSSNMSNDMSEPTLIGVEHYGDGELARGLDDNSNVILPAMQDALDNGGTVRWSMASFVQGGDRGEERINYDANVSGDDPPTYEDPETGEETPLTGNDDAARTALKYAAGEQGGGGNGAYGEKPVLILASGEALNMDGSYEAVAGGEFKVNSIHSATADERTRWKVPENTEPVTVVSITQVANVKLPPGVSST